MVHSTEEQAKRAADQFREKHDLGTQPLGDLVALIEQTTGHDVAILDTTVEEHGLIMRDPARDRVFVGIARTPHPMRQRSSLAHELGHLVFGDHSDDLTRRSREEVRADAFARHLLAPLDGLLAWLGAGVNVTEATLSDVVQRYLVSPAIAAIVMRDAGYIEAERAAEWRAIPTRMLATRFGWSDYYTTLQADANRLRAPQGLLARAIRGYAEGVVSAQTIATLRGVAVDDLLKEFEEASIFPKEYETSEFELDDLPPVDVDLSGLEDSAVAQ